LDRDGKVGPIAPSIAGILPRLVVNPRMQALQDHSMPPACESLIAELELAVKDDLLENRTKTLRRITDLFINDADRLNDEQIKVFDDVLCLLIRRIEGRALVELSNRLAPVDTSPIEVIRRLAWDEDIAVAEPVLAQSRRLPLSDLIEISAVRSQAHLLAICGRYQLPESVTDVLLSRGDEEVVFKLATNTRARFSQTGYGILVDDAEGDDRLTETVALRFDIPQRLLRELLERATEAVRSRILAIAPPETRDDIQRVVTDIAKSVGNAAVTPRDFSDAERIIAAMEARGKLDETALLDFVNQRKYEEMTVALTRLCSASLKLVSGLMMGLRNDALLVPCRAADLKWPTVEAILRNRHSNHKISDQVIQLACGDYERLSVATARRTLRFMQVRETAK
jgi:uncharacterized protein (DUF2336 family)